MPLAAEQDGFRSLNSLLLAPACSVCPCRRCRSSALFSSFPPLSFSLSLFLPFLLPPLFLPSLLSLSPPAPPAHKKKPPTTTIPPSHHHESEDRHASRRSRCRHVGVVGASVEQGDLSSCYSLFSFFRARRQETFARPDHDHPARFRRPCIHRDQRCRRRWSREHLYHAGLSVWGGFGVVRRKEGGDILRYIEIEECVCLMCVSVCRCGEGSHPSPIPQQKVINSLGALVDCCAPGSAVSPRRCYVIAVAGVMGCGSSSPSLV